MRPPDNPLSNVKASLLPLQFREVHILDSMLPDRISGPCSIREIATAPSRERGLRSSSGVLFISTGMDRSCLFIRGKGVSVLIDWITVNCEAFSALRDHAHAWLRVSARKVPMIQVVRKFCPAPIIG